MTTAHVQREYVDAAVTARLLRQALREAYPSVRFTVRTSKYAGGASIDVGWVDGPTTKQVQAITHLFKGAYFDGMIDYKGSRYHTLDGRPVCWGADFIHEERSYSPATIEAAIMHVMTTRGEMANAPWPGVRLHEDGTAWIDGGDWAIGGIGSIQVGGTLYGDQLVMLRAQETSYTEPLPSPTAARVTYAGDEGYHG